MSGCNGGNNHCSQICKNLLVLPIFFLAYLLASDVFGRLHICVIYIYNYVDGKQLQASWKGIP